MTSVFISHPRSDPRLYDVLVDELEANGISVFRADDIAVGENWQSEILAGIKRSQVVIAYLGSDEVNSNVMLEIGYAMGAGKKVVLVSDGPSRIPFDIASLPVFTADKPTFISPTATRHAIQEVVEYVRGIAVKEVTSDRPHGSARDVLTQAIDDPVYLEKIPPREFEELIAEYFREVGFEAELKSGNRDGGFDIVLHGVVGHDYVVVETKRYTSQSRIGVNDVQRLVGAAVVARATCAILITSGSFTRSAMEFARQAPLVVRLYTLEDLLNASAASITKQ